MDTIRDVIISLVAVIAAALLGWERLVTGKTGLKEQIISDYKVRNEQLEERMKVLEGQVNALTASLKEMRAVIEAKDQHINSLTQILQGKNPEMVEVLTGIRTFLEAQSRK